jgi:hypothetical protein
MSNELTIPTDLVEAVARGNAVAFVGAGLSQAAGLPGWATAVKQLVEWGPSRGFPLSHKSDLSALIAKGELLLVVDDLRETYGWQAFHEALLSVFDRPNLQPTDTHLLITQIPFRAVLTTNYDMLLEAAYVIRDKRQPPVYLQTQEAELSHALRDDAFHIVTTVRLMMISLLPNHSVAES